jgi:hypothetical protein
MQTDYIKQYTALTEFFKKPSEALCMGEVYNVTPVAFSSFTASSNVVLEAVKLLYDGYKSYKRVIYGNMNYGLTICFKSPAGQKNVNYPLSNLDIKSYLDMSDPAPYGDLKTGNTTVDTSVRKCHQIDSKYIDYVRIEEQQEIKNTIKYCLFPDHENISIVFNKVNIYKQEGHFTRHVDTPKENVIGTLVVFAASKFTGGDLVVYDDETNPTVVNKGWCAYYSNVPHEVKPVESGCRVTFTFYIMSKECKDVFDADSPVLKDKGPVPVLEYCQDLFKPDSILNTIEKNLPIGIVLEETYSQSETQLKGRDATLIKDLQSKFQVDVYHALVVHNESYGEGPATLVMTCHVYRCLPCDFSHICENASLEPLKETERDVTFYNYAQQDDTCYDSSQPYIEYTGNECQEGLAHNVYFAMVAIVRKND